MKLNPDFIAREIAGEFVIVPVGADVSSDVGLISTNAVGQLIWERLADGAEPDGIVAAILDEFDVNEATARRDAEEFISQLENLGAVSR